MNAAEDDVLRLQLCCGLAESIAVTLVVAILNHAPALVVMGQDDEIIGKLAFAFFDVSAQFLVGHGAVRFWCPGIGSGHHFRSRPLNNSTVVVLNRIAIIR